MKIAVNLQRPAAQLSWNEQTFETTASKKSSKGAEGDENFFCNEGWSGKWN